MKIITDYFPSPSVKNKKCNSTDLLDKSTSSESNSITTLEDSPHYQTRKIKIRLADPNVPDSYVCEVYDTSIEEENNTTSTNEPEKNCAFNILMAGKGKDKKDVASKKRTRQTQISDTPGTDSSDDESLIFVKKKLKIAMLEEKKENNKATNSNLPAVNKSDNFPDISSNNSRKKSLRQKESVPILPLSVIETTLPSKKLKHENKLLCESVPNEIPSRTKRIKKSGTNIEQYFSKKGNSSKGRDDSVINCKGSISQSSIKPRRETNDIQNNECVVVLEKVSLAPMFRKSVKKAPVDPEVLKARQAFLQKGLPNALAKKVSKERLEERNVQVFPVVSHVLQSCGSPLWKKRNINLILNNIESQYTPELCWKSFISNQNLHRNLINKIKRVANVSDHLNNLSKIYKNIEVCKLFDVLTNIRESHNNNQISTTWSNKYKLRSSDFLSNETTIAKLEKWLLSWKNYGENIKNVALRQCGESSDSDFVSSDGEDEKSSAPITACLLQGPISSGKTALVQTLASELDFHILEVNSASKRSGKKMLADLQEATKSHKILQEANGNVGTSLKGEKMAIIVVEEADIIFEDHDDGFLFGLQTLINSAKRPVILLTSEPSAAHLEKFRSSHTLQLKLVRTQLTTSCAFLELVTLVEGSIVPRSAILKMLSLNSCDLRQSLLQLQFWVQHGSNHSTWPIINNQRCTTGSMWWLSHQLLFNNDLWHSELTNPRISEEKIINEKNDESPKKSVPLKASRYDYFEYLSLCDMFQGNSVSSNMEISNFDVKIKDSSSLGANLEFENLKQKLFQNEVIEEILMRNLSSVKKDKSNINLHDIPVKDKRWLTSQTRASDELSQVVPNRTSSTARFCDYLPALREICRAEEKREVGNTKRSNRFYHYIKTLGGSPTPSNLNINCSVLFQDV